MNESVWLAANDPLPMFGYAGGLSDYDSRWLLQFPGDRKARLFAVACCRLLDGFPWRGERIPLRDRAVNPATDQVAVAAVQTAELYSDGGATAEELVRANRAMSVACTDNQGDARYEAVFVTTCPTIRPRDAALCSLEAIHADLPPDDPVTGERFWLTCVALEAGREIHARLLRCVFGNPFRPVAIGPAWLTSTVTALQDAECDNDNVLNHCRDTGPHARGCWVVDLLLGKS